MEQEATNGVLEDFRIEFLEAWSRLPNKGLFFGLLAAWVALFQFLGNSTLGYINSPSLLKWMYLAYQPGVSQAASDDGHGKIIPFLVLGLMWWKRKQLLAVELRTWWPGLLLVGFGLFTHLVGYAVQQPRVSIVGLFVGLYGLMGATWGPDFLRASFFPFFLFVFSVPLGSVAESITFPLRLLVCQIVEGISHFVSIDIIRTGTALRDPTNHYQYDVAAACSGIRSLIAIFLMATTYAFVVFRRWGPRAMLMALAFPLAVAGNVLRMMTIVVAAEMGGQSWGNAAHESSVISLLPYVPAILGLLWVGRLMEDWQKKHSRKIQSKGGTPGPGSTGGAGRVDLEKQPA